MAAIMGLSLTACMNLEPIDPNVVQMNEGNKQEIIDKLYYKLYVSFVQTGQTGGGGDADIISNDEGYSGFYRTLCVLNEFPTDAGWWTWRGDDGVSDLLMLYWTPSNGFVSKLYNRLNYAVTMANHYLDLTEGANTPEAKARRAEVRFIRAVNYYHLLDMFGNVPFTVTVSTADPEQIDRKSLYNWLVDELTTGHSGKENTYLNRKTKAALTSYKVTDDAGHGLIDDLYEAGATTVYRVNKNAAKMLLARLYLNAEVYAGEAKWAEAEAVAKELVAAYPTLHKPYAEIFMGDNDVAAPEEMIFLAACDGVAIRSYAGSHYAVCSTRNANMNPCATSNNSWGCWRACPELVKAFFPGKTPAEIEALGHDADEFEMPAIANDDRAMFSVQNDYVDAASGTPKVNQKGFQGYVPANGDGFDSCWAICKWTNYYHTEFIIGTDGKLHPMEFPGDYITPQRDAFWCDADYPVMRAAEAYMTYAEALYRQNKPEALAIVNQVRERANAAPLAELTADELLDEWLREFYHEGRRRIDLIRFGQFVGDKVTRTWEGRSGCNESVATILSFPLNDHSKWNTEVAKIDAYRTLYPIPETDVVSNPNVIQNDGYAE